MSPGLRRHMARVNVLQHAIHRAHFDGCDFRTAVLCLLRAWLHLRLGARRMFGVVSDGGRDMRCG